MSLRTSALAGISALALYFASADATAHELETNTARVTMRDGNVVIYGEVDVVTWLDALGEDRSTRTAVPFALSDVDPAELARRSAEARRQLTSELRVEIDGRARNLRLREFPSDDTIVRAAARDLVARQIDDHAHRQLSRIVVDVIDTVDSVSDLEPRGTPTILSVTMPASLGEVLVNFVQPQTQLAPAGTPRQFRILRADAAPEPTDDPQPLDTQPPSPTERPSTADLVGLLGAFAAGLLCGTVAWRRKREAP